MRMPHLLLGTLLLGAGLTGCQEAPVAAGDRQAAASHPAAPAPAWELLADQAYEARVRSLIAGARSGVDLVMFSAVLPDDAGATHPVRLLLEALIERHRAGVPVRVVLDQGAPPGRDRPSAHAFRVLAEAGVAVRWDEDERTTHIKALVVDRRWCVLGSHNWTFSALRRNREQSLLVDDPALALRLGGEFTRLWDGLADAPSPRRKR
jgi:phosphatidylserine/phosphatidylglycerophosphate/cardiolipin synthase-like enzyme